MTTRKAIVSWHSIMFYLSRSPEQISPVDLTPRSADFSANRPWSHQSAFQDVFITHASSPRSAQSTGTIPSRLSSDDSLAPFVKSRRNFLQEFHHLKAKESSAACMLYAAKWMALSPVLKSIKMMSLCDTFTLNRYKTRNQYYKNRACFNGTGMLSYLHDYLPYRKQLAANHSVEGLKKYDQLVQTILQKAEFYETTTKLEKCFASKNMQYDPLTDTLEETMRKNLQAYPRLQDESLKTLIAGQIAELLYQRPEAVQLILNRPDFPLRFMVGFDSPPKDYLGSYQASQNTIYLNAPSMYLISDKCLMAQHEFVHALSLQDFNTDDRLSWMSEQQKQQYQNARTAVQKTFRQQFNTLNGRLQFWLTGKNQAGMVNHGFSDNQEFLAVSLDAFRCYPGELCKTKAGRTLYELYRDLFAIDPLNDFHSA